MHTTQIKNQKQSRVRLKKMYHDHKCITHANKSQNVAILLAETATLDTLVMWAFDGSFLNRCLTKSKRGDDRNISAISTSTPAGAAATGGNAGTSPDKSCEVTGSVDGSSCVAMHASEEWTVAIVGR